MKRARRGLAVGVALAAASCGDVAPPAAPCEASRVPVSLDAGPDALPLCAGLAITEDERRAGLTAWPQPEGDDALLIVFPVEGELCITTAVLTYAIDVVFTDARGDITEVACDRGPADPDVCVDAAAAVLELLPQPGCDTWPGGRVDVGPWTWT